MTSLDIEHLNIAQCVCKRPKLYTAHGTLAEVLALFDGYDIALRYGSSRPKDTSPSHVMDWLNNQFESKVIDPRRRLAHLLEQFQSEGQALIALEKIASDAATP